MTMEMKTKPCVLVAEDADVNRMLITDMLETLGYEVDAVENGAEALEHVRARSHDLVLMDLRMPVMDGMAAARAILAENPAAPPILALSAIEDTARIEECLSAGMRAFIAKPVSREALKETLEHWLAGKGEGSEPQPGPGLPLLDGYDVDTAFVDSLMLRAPEKAATFARLTLQDGRRLLDEMERALKHFDTRAAGDAAHALKSVAMQAGAKELAVSARVMESGAAFLPQPDALILLGSMRDDLEKLADVYAKYMKKPV